jgi:hypothetical protein
VRVWGDRDRRQQVDRDEDERHGGDRGDEPRAGLRSRDERQADPIARGRRGRFENSRRRLEQELAIDTAANKAYGAFHASGCDTQGRRMGKHPKPYDPPVLPERMVNLTDSDSRLIHDKRMARVQGYNARAAVSCDGPIPRFWSARPDLWRRDPWRRDP